LYASQDFLPHRVGVEMKYSLSALTHYDLFLPPNIKALPISKETSFDELYSCWCDAFSAGDSLFFSDLNDQQRRDFFNSLGNAGSLNRDASFILLKGSQIIGLSFVLPGGQKNLHISNMCIHPDFQGNGFGKAILLRSMQSAKEQGYKTMSLFTDTHMVAYKLYCNIGWQVTGKQIIYRRE